MPIHSAPIRVEVGPGQFAVERGLTPRLVVDPLKRFIGLCLQPTRTLRTILTGDRGLWAMPLLLLSLSSILLVMFSAPILHAEKLANPPPPPRDFDYFPPEMQEEYFEALEVINGPMFMYVFPLVMSLSKVWFGWLLVGGVLHLVLTLLGARSSSKSMLVLAAWSGLPYVLRDAVRIVYALASDRLVAYPGLSGHLDEAFISANPFLAEMTSFIDLYLLWQCGLILVGLSVLNPNGKTRSALSVALVLLMMLTFQTLPGFLGDSLGSMKVIRPYF